MGDGIMKIHKKLGRKLLLWGLIAGCSFIPLMDVEAAVREISGTGEYIMEDNETMKQAQDKAYEEAMRSIAQQVAVFVRGSSKTENMELKEDEVELMATALVQVKEKRFTKEVMADGKLRVKAFLTGDIDEEAAEKALEEKVAKFKQQKALDEAKAKHAAQQGAKEAAQKEYNEAMRHTVTALLADGEALLKQGKYAAAMEKFNEVIKDHPDYAKGYVRRGECYSGMGKMEAAMQDFNKAITLDPKEAESYYGRGQAYEKQGKKQEAIADYRKFLEVSNIVEHGDKITATLDRLAKLEG